MVVGAFQVSSAVQKPLVFEASAATAHGVCLLLSEDSKPVRA